MPPAARAVEDAPRRRPAAPPSSAVRRGRAIPVDWAARVGRARGSVGRALRRRAAGVTPAEAVWPPPRPPSWSDKVPARHARPADRQRAALGYEQTKRKSSRPRTRPPMQSASAAQKAPADPPPSAWRHVPLLVDGRSRQPVAVWPFCWPSKTWATTHVCLTCFIRRQRSVLWKGQGSEPKLPLAATVSHAAHRPRRTPTTQHTHLVLCGRHPRRGARYGTFRRVTPTSRAVSWPLCRKRHRASAGTTAAKPRQSPRPHSRVKELLNMIAVFGSPVCGGANRQSPKRRETAPPGGKQHTWAR